MSSYKIGNFLTCKKEVTGPEIEMTNPNIKISLNDLFVITNFVFYSDKCQFIEILGLKGDTKGMYFSGYNDKDHEIFDWCFENINLEIIPRKD